jgi:hypothetical protein
MRIAPLERTPWILKPFFFVTRRMFGKILTPDRVYARRPLILLTRALLMAAVEYSTVLDKRVKRIVSIRTAQIVGCPF